MAKTPKIVVGIDGSEPSLSALRWASARAEAFGASLEVVLAWHRPAQVYPADWAVYMDAADVELEAKHRLEQAVSETISGALPVTTTLVHGDAAEAVAEAGSDALQIVVGSHGYGFLGRALLGSVAERVVTESSVPVTVVPPSVAPPTGDVAIVVGVDGSPSSAAALRFAAKAATTLDGSLKVIHTYPIIGPASAAEMKEMAEHLIATMIATATTDGFAMPARTRSVATPGNAGLRLLEGSAEASELVVGYSGAAERPLTLGSVGRRCLHHAHCPVTVVKAP